MADEPILDIEQIAKDFHKKYPNPNLTWEDYAQEYRIAILEEESPQVAWSRMYGLFSSMTPGIQASHNREAPFVYYLSDGFDIEMGQEADEQIIIEATDEELKEWRHQFLTAIQSQNKIDKALMILTLCGFNPRELEKMFGSSRETLRKRVNRILRRMRDERSNCADSQSNGVATSKGGAFVSFRNIR